MAAEFRYLDDESETVCSRLAVREKNQSELAVLAIRRRALDASLTPLELQDVMGPFADRVESADMWIESASIFTYSLDQAAKLAGSLFKSVIRAVARRGGFQTCMFMMSVYA
ncbi:MAG: hypothetical protein EOO22_05965 [Comamonadaceae bacterium]|nr:MAG: hypothetical protein EOO22_05965 [Comamonadaceae bacterium]